jgi:hypothetical protein
VAAPGRLAGRVDQHTSRLEPGHWVDTVPLRLCGTHLGTQGCRPHLRATRGKAGQRWVIQRSDNLESLGQVPERLHSTANNVSKCTENLLCVTVAHHQHTSRLEPGHWVDTVPLRLCGTHLGTQGCRPALRATRGKAGQRWVIERSDNLDSLGQVPEARDTRLHLRK